jgi:tetratricopeptide (TPR) repeat protein
MQVGNRRKPTINPISVEAALNTLAYTTTDVSAAATLQALAIVEEFLHSPTRSPAKNLREFAIKSILCELIEATLNQYRKASELRLPHTSDALSTAIRQIQLDSQQNSADLLGWSFLYYRFVRVDLGISQEKYGEYANIEARSLRRYKKYIIEKLSEKLIQLEWDARRRQHQIRLLASIPTDTRVTLVGRDKQLQSALDVLHRRQAAKFYLTGAKGIGKTAFLSVLVQQLVAIEALDYVVWISSPRSVDEIMNTIHEAIMPPHSRLELKEVLFKYTTLIVLDDVSKLADAGENITELSELLAPCMLCLSSERHLTLMNTVFHIHLEELNPQQVHKQVQLLKPDLGAELAGDYAVAIWQQVGGNPRAVQLALIQIEEGSTVALAHDTLSHLYHATFSSLTMHQKRMWAFIAMMNNRQMPLSALHFFIERELFTQADLAHLMRIFIVQQASSNVVTISQSAQQFILAQQPYPDQFIDVLLKHIFDLQAQVDSLIIHHLCLQLLLNDTLQLSSSRTANLVRNGWQANHHSHDLHKWAGIFYKNHYLLEKHTDIKLAYGICLRRLNDVKVAQQVFEELLAATGIEGDFKTQASVLVEMAILKRKQGQYELAHQCLERVTQRPANLQDDSMNHRILGELAQIEIERGKLQSALHLLNQMSSKSTHTQILEAETLLALAQLEKCQQLSYQILPILLQAQDYNQLISLKTILARSQQVLKHFDKAIDLYNAALSYAERQHDDYAIARLQCNLATLLVHQHEIASAEALLRDAEAIQIELNDRVGLEVTRQNLQYLRYIKMKSTNNA